MYQSRAWTYVAVLAVCLCWSSLQAGVQDQVITDPAEVAALKAIKKSLIDPNNKLSNWNRGDPCTANWTGVWCFDGSLDDGYLHVQELRLLNMNLLGTLSPDLGRLSYMIILDFMWNNISGSIPKDIGNITSLELLLLSGNQLSGPLPEELGNLMNLDRIQIDQNQISGPLPKSFANLDKTKHFHMNNNSISGQIPPELSRLPNLVHLFLDNNLSGYLPPEFSELPNLLILELDNNNFDGSTIPASYGNMSKLLKLSLRNCNLQGPVPDLSRIPKLQYLDLSRNQLNGSIPLGKLSDEITAINLSNNTLTGSIPINFSGLPQLQRLSIANNSLSGSVPATLWNDTTLNATERLILELQNNKLTKMSGSTETPQNVTVWLQGNPICLNGNLDNLCGSEIGDENGSESSTNSTASCPSQACPPPVESAPEVCFCAAPLLIKYRLKSPGFSDFRPYKSTFEEYLTSSLDLNLGQLDIASYIWENGPRLSMSLKLFPVYVAANANNSYFFNTSEVQRILGEFTSWKIPDTDLFGPYELLQITLLDPYISGSSPPSPPSPGSSPPSTGSSSPSPGSSSLSRDWIIGMSVGISMTILVIVSSIYISRKRILFFFKKDEKAELDVEALIRNYGSLTPKRYRYSNLHKITNSFKDQIGKGGFGTVYKGKLADDDDLLVAVKVLRELEGGGEDFINEVASIGRSSHVNVVTIVGFCYKRDKRALIYEYMPNGSLDKFIRKQGSSSADCSLDYWKTLSKIAVGIARGLEYLHRGCNTRILHFDIKLQNILLDNDLCPKISDFGLAKLCKTKESIITHPGIRGTAGYMAPEVYSRNFGGVSHKSDVYSYGMLVLEMVGARRNLYSQVSESHTSEEFPHYIYKDLELLDNDENIYGATSEEEKEIARKMIIVGLGCIQTIPSDRPSMHKVLEMLEGPLQSLSVPPKPLFISTARYVAEASVTTSEPSESGQGNQF